MTIQAEQTVLSEGVVTERLETGTEREESLGRQEHHPPQQGHLDPAQRLARGLGWFSLGLGLAQVAAPRALARMIGVRPTRRSTTVIRAIGVREVAAGLGILTQSRTAGWLSARVGYDVTDLALLSSMLTSPRNNRPRLAAAAAVTVGLTILDSRASRELRRPGGAVTEGRAAGVTKAITVDCTPEEAYLFWRDLQNLPRFIAHLESVKPSGDGRSHWVAKTPIGTTVEWEAEVSEDRPGQLIAWQSLDDAKVMTSGSARFVRAPGGRGTEVHFELSFEPPGGVAGALMGKLFGKGLGQHLASDLRRFKQIIETGEVVRSEASIYRRPHPAQPPPEPTRTATP